MRFCTHHLTAKHWCIGKTLDPSSSPRMERASLPRLKISNPAAVPTRIRMRLGVKLGARLGRRDRRLWRPEGRRNNQSCPIQTTPYRIVLIMRTLINLSQNILQRKFHDLRYLISCVLLSLTSMAGRTSWLT
jgi:hypothetical protein